MQWEWDRDLVTNQAMNQSRKLNNSLVFFAEEIWMLKKVLQKNETIKFWVWLQVHLRQIL